MKEIKIKKNSRKTNFGFSLKPNGRGGCLAGKWSYGQSGCAFWGHQQGPLKLASCETTTKTNYNGKSVLKAV